ncbi:MAG: HlyD family type I secretion periplasmic adaptor subunit [Proteobacteria bacterium]|nr:HlyD family type I secretion periplasmic adaptor subunit [Pseudomonadota bacterium]MBS0573061.1 HlyD family type I secretion periplasmic adaptor subunit [Pseudomonadota bacterium]
MGASAREFPQAPAPRSTLRDDFRSPAVAGGLGLTALLALLVLWAKVTMISGAVIAHGQIVVHGKPKIVQTLDGGEIRRIAVTDGDRVKAGQVLIELDPTPAQVTLGVARARLAVALAREARLRAEQLDLPAPVFDYRGLPFAAPDTAAEEEGQRQIFAARAEVNRGRREKLGETKAAFEQQIAGTQGQIDAVRAQIALTEKDLADITVLVGKGLARQSQQSDLERAKAELYGRLSALQAEQASARTAIRDAEIEVLQAERAFKEAVVTEMRDATTAIQEQTLEVVNRLAQLKRMDIRAPSDGIVNQLQATTVGGVFPPGATALEIVPTDAGLDFEVRVDPKAIDQVRPGQKVRLVLSALPRSTTPDLIGAVTGISADAIIDPVTGQRFYKAGVAVPADEMKRVSDMELVPGMPVEAYLQTGDRSVLAYLLKPLTDHLNNAFREE